MAHMKLIFFHGPPASGKLTIAEKLSEMTDIPLFHNHLSRDLVANIYKDKLRQHYDLVSQLRFDVLNYCAKHDTDLIFTYVYEGVDDDDEIRKFIDIIESSHGEVIFVELLADKEDLIKRADSPSRKKYKKLTDPIKMDRITARMDIYSIPFVDAIKINTSQLDPDSAAKYIAEKLLT
jgi:hypothetical protein